MTVTRQTIINDILEADPATEEFFTDIGMACLGCPASTGENIEQACWVHGQDADRLVSRLNEYFERKA